MELLRTPESRFDGLEGFAYEPHYTTVDAGDGSTDPVRVHYLDEGPREARETVVCLHGEPSWCYLYRGLLDPLVAAGYRVVAPDLVGFGRSDKPAQRSAHTYARHVEWVRSTLFDRLGLEGVTLVCQDWGGLIGLRLVAEHPERFRRVVAANTGLPTGDGPMSDAFLTWQRFAREVPEMQIGRIVQNGTAHDLPPAVVAAYDAPFPDERYKEGPRQMPSLVPTAPDDPAAADNRRAWEGLGRFERPFLCAFSDGDPITRGADRLFVAQVPGTAGLEHVTIADAGHFLQEDQPAALADAVICLVGATPDA